MKNLNTIIAALAIAMSMASCSHEDAMEQIQQEELQQEISKAPVKVLATTNTTETRTSLDNALRVLWSEGDRIAFVNNNDHNSAIFFTLSSGAEQTTGEFTMDADQPALTDGEYSVYYPATWDGSTENWPEQVFTPGDANIISNAPMKATATVSNGGTTISALSFTNEGGVLRYFVNSEERKELRCVVIKGDGIDITYSCQGIKAYNMFFNIAVPAGTYNNVTLTFYGNDKPITSAVKRAATMTIAKNKVYKANFMDLTFTPSFIDLGDAIDFGLDVKWGKKNVGAATEKDWGDYFAWGEAFPRYNGYTRTGTNLTFDGWKPTAPDGYSSSKWPNPTSTPYLGPAHDPATKHLEGDWHTPSEWEFTQLRDNTTWTWDDTDHGYYVTPKGVALKADKSNAALFIPGAYHLFNKDIINNQEPTVCYWTRHRTLAIDNAKAYYFDPKIVGGEYTDDYIGYMQTFNGLPIRPVR